MHQVRRVLGRGKELLERTYDSDLSAGLLEVLVIHWKAADGHGMTLIAQLSAVLA